MRQRAGHRDEQAAERAHERRERPGAGDAAQDRAEHAEFRGEQRGQFEHDLVRALDAGEAGVELRHEVAPDHAEHRREDVEDADENHHPHRRALGGDAVGVRVEAHEDVRQPGRAADQRDDERIGVEQRIGLLVFREVGGALLGRQRGGGGVDGLGRQRAEGRDPRGVLRRFFDERLALDRSTGAAFSPGAALAPSWPL